MKKVINSLLMTIIIISMIGKDSYAIEDFNEYGIREGKDINPTGTMSIQSRLTNWGTMPSKLNI